jgi:replicative DNA helicase
MENFEQLVIGSILLDGQCIASIEAIISPDDFLNLDYSEVYRAMVQMNGDGSPIDVFTLSDILVGQKYNTKMGMEVLSDIQENIPSALHATYYAEGVLNLSLKRKVSGLVSIAQDEDLSGSEAVEEAMKQLTSICHSSGETMKSGNSVRDAFILQLEARANGSVTHQTTGFPDIDEMIDGLVKGRLYVIGGRPGSGKTALALNFSLEALKNKVPTLIFNMEMPDTEVYERLTCAAGSVNLKNPKNMGDDEWNKVLAAIGNILTDSPLTIDDSTGYKIGHIKNSIRMHHQKHGDSFVIIDYLQLINHGAINDNVGYSQITRDLKSLAKELKIPIVLLAQVNRGCESRPDKRPVASDLRDSGGIESDADCILMCYRDVVYNPDTEFKDTAEIIIRKNRQGSSGTVYVKSRLEFYQFLPMSNNFVSQG